MDTAQITNSLSWLGDKFGLVTQKVIVFLSERGVSLTATQSKIFDLAIILILLFILIKFIEITSKVAKVIIFSLLFILGISLIISFI